MAAGVGVVSVWTFSSDVVESMKLRFCVLVRESTLWKSTMSSRSVLLLWTSSADSGDSGDCDTVCEADFTLFLLFFKPIF